MAIVWMWVVLSTTGIAVLGTTPSVLSTMRIFAAAQGIGQGNNSGKRQGTDAASPKAVEPTANTAKREKSATSVAPEGKHQGETVTRITKMPPVAIADKSKSLWAYVFDWGPWLFAAILVIVGIVGVRYAKHTLDAIKRQANIMEQQAIDAQKSSTEAAVLAGGMLEAIQEQGAQMKQQASAMERQITVSEKSARSAEDNAIAAKTSAKAARDLLELTQAASIQVFSIGLRRGRFPLGDDSPVTNDASVALTFKNFGPTRALKITVNGTLGIASSNKSTAVAPPVAYEIPPGTEVPIVFDAFNSWLDPDTLAILKQGKLSLQTSLTIAYADVFGIPHKIRVEAALSDWVGRGWGTSTTTSRRNANKGEEPTRRALAARCGTLPTRPQVGGGAPKSASEGCVIVPGGIRATRTVGQDSTPGTA